MLGKFLKSVLLFVNFQQRFLLNTVQFEYVRLLIVCQENERSALALRFDIPNIDFFGANVTISRQSSSSILVKGKFDARLRFGELLDVETIIGEFDTILLNNFGSEKGKSFCSTLKPSRYEIIAALSLDDEMDYDDEVDSNGNIDIGEITSQYLALELYQASVYYLYT